MGWLGRFEVGQQRVVILDSEIVKGRQDSSKEQAVSHGVQVNLRHATSDHRVKLFCTTYSHFPHGSCFTGTSL